VVPRPSLFLWQPRSKDRQKQRKYDTAQQTSERKEAVTRKGSVRMPMFILTFFIGLMQWFLTFLALLLLELAKKGRNPPPPMTNTKKGKSRKNDKVVLYSHPLSVQ
jgi:hypothetical protein